MDLDEYQRRAGETAAYRDQGGFGGLTYTVLGLASEAGEVAGKLKRSYRGDEDVPGMVGFLEYEPIRKELGDVLWYVAQVATELKIPLSALAEQNLTKLASRKDRGVLKGAGDNR